MWLRSESLPGPTASSLVLAFMISLCMSVPVEAQRWKQESLYPARVRAMVFNNRMDASSCVAWGNWTACFGRQPPIAELSSAGAQRSVSIRPLLCHNPVRGEVECQVSLHWSFEFPGHNFCTLHHSLGRPDADALFIGCPNELVLG